MDAAKIRETITQKYIELLKAANPESDVELTDDLVLLSSGLDSLGFAILVANLEEELGWDPFTISDSPFYPERFGDFVAFYENNQP